MKVKFPKIQKRRGRKENGYQEAVRTASKARTLLEPFFKQQDRLREGGMNLQGPTKLAASFAPKPKPAPITALTSTSRPGPRRSKVKAAKEEKRIYGKLPKSIPGLNTKGKLQRVGKVQPVIGERQYRAAVTKANLDIAFNLLPVAQGFKVVRLGRAAQMAQEGRTLGRLEKASAVAKSIARHRRKVQLRGGGGFAMSKLKYAAEKGVSRIPRINLANAPLIGRRGTNIGLGRGAFRDAEFNVAKPTHQIDKFFNAIKNRWQQVEVKGETSNPRILMKDARRFRRRVSRAKRAGIKQDIRQVQADVRATAQREASKRAVKSWERLKTGTGVPIRTAPVPRENLGRALKGAREAERNVMKSQSLNLHTRRMINAQARRSQIQVGGGPEMTGKLPFFARNPKTRPEPPIHDRNASIGRTFRGGRSSVGGTPTRGRQLRQKYPEAAKEIKRDLSRNRMRELRVTPEMLAGEARGRRTRRGWNRLFRKLSKKKRRGK